jgi:hypothetical protein
MAIRGSWKQLSWGLVAVRASVAVFFLVVPDAGWGSEDVLRGPHGDGTVTLSGVLQQWHTVTLDLSGPFATEQDASPNPFTDYRMTVRFEHALTGKSFLVPGYFAANGQAAETSAESGTVWRTLFVPNATGRWTYEVLFHAGADVAITDGAGASEVAPFHGGRGTFEVAPSTATGRDLRAHGFLQYVGQRYLRFAGSGEYFLKAGADAPETLLGYADFDNTIAGKPEAVPLKTWSPHLRDWQEGDPIWQGIKGRGLIGAINYLSGKGCNAFSFLTYNAGGDGDNVWPFVERNDKLHYDCSKLDQWGIVFDHGTRRGMYLHFKLQETENDDNRRGKRKQVAESLDGGDLGRERKLYCRELIARFGHNLALNWNLGEENSQSTQQQRAMLDFIADLDPYDHLRVVHTFPDQQDQVYLPLLGDGSRLTGASLQNSSLGTTHAQTVKWVEASTKAGKPWVVAFDESGSAAHAQCPDLGYRGFDGHDRQGVYAHTQHDVRKQTLWGTLMGGGAGNEYYFGYQFVENDLVCEDWRSRDQSWDYCRIALSFFKEHAIPFWEMVPSDALAVVANEDPATWCLAKPNDVYVVYTHEIGNRASGPQLDLSDADGRFDVWWFDPQLGDRLHAGGSVEGGRVVALGMPPSDAGPGDDWVILLRRHVD